MNKLTIITINYNNASGFQKTMESVFAQTSKEFEYIVVDGNSTDSSKEIIAQFAKKPIEFNFQWKSEPDSGIYNAMNKGIRMAKGEYVQFVNSGDILVNSQVVEQMLFQLATLNSQPSILYGNMLKSLAKRVHIDNGPRTNAMTMLDFYNGTLNHSSAYIKRSLFDQFGLYDETLKIVSDWKWYLQVIALNGIQPVYVNIDVTLFDMNGISTINRALDKTERRKVLEELLPLSILKDYDRYAFPMEQFDRINRYWLTRKAYWLVERVLFKWEKWRMKANNTSY